MKLKQANKTNKTYDMQVKKKPDFVHMPKTVFCCETVNKTGDIQV